MEESWLHDMGSGGVGKVSAGPVVDGEPPKAPKHWVIAWGMRVLLRTAKENRLGAVGSLVERCSKLLHC